MPTSDDRDSVATAFCRSRSQHSYSRPRTSVPDRAATPIAVVGMSMRLPGGVNTAERFWDMLLDRRDGCCEIPSSRYSIEGFYDEHQPHTTKTTRGHFLLQDPALFDAHYFSISAHDASRMDPQQRMLLEVVQECLDNAGETGWRGKDIGCYVGVFGNDWQEIAEKDFQHVDRYHALGCVSFALANRVSFEYDFRGPSVTIETGCSSSMVGIHDACRALEDGACSAAIVAGTNLILTPTMTTVMSENMLLSPHGICRTFDARADGYARGEAINALYLKRLDDAIASGDPIRAIIRSTATNFDGHTPSITVPSTQAQEKLIRAAYKRAGIEKIWETGLFECHGTGTKVGDTVETSTLAKTFEGHGVLIGAVKPNVGHSEGASGITSMIKAILALEHRMIPPNAHFAVPSPRIPFEEGQLKVPVCATPWPEDRSLRASVNCFGIGGSNAHVVLEAADIGTPAQYNPTAILDDSCRLLVVSAATESALKARVGQVVQYINSHPDRLQDLAYTLGVRREHLDYRAFAVGYSDAPLGESDFTFLQASSRRPQLTWVFSGQGAQWTGMGRDLLEGDVGFLADIRKLEQALSRIVDPPAWSLEEELRESSRTHKASLSQPLCTAVQIGLVNIFKRWGLQASSVVGHSSGEIAAAYASGAISAELAIILAYYRGQVVKEQEGMGGMASVNLNCDHVARYLEPGVMVACENSLQNTLIAGPNNKLGRVVARIKENEPDAFCRPLQVGIAYHSESMLDVGAQYEAAITPYIQLSASMLPMASCVTGQVTTQPLELGAAYWRRNLESRVLFSPAIHTLLENHGANIFMELGPHAILAAPLRQIFQNVNKNISPVYIPTMVRNVMDGSAQLLGAAGLAYGSGATINLSAIVGYGQVLTDLPPYPWDHRVRYWKESRVSHDWRSRRQKHHEILGSRVVDSTSLELSWRNLLRLEDVPWLNDHRLRNEVVFPGAGYVAMVGEAVRELHPSSSGYAMRRVFFKVPLLLNEYSPVELVTHLGRIKINDFTVSDWLSFSVVSYDASNQNWIEHCHGQVLPRHGDQPPAQNPVSPYIRTVSADRWYHVLATLGLEYGPSFRGLRDITADPSTRRSTGTVHDNAVKNPAQYHVHPTTIDQCLQLMSVAAASGLPRRLEKGAIPSMIEEISVGVGEERLDLHAQVETAPHGSLWGDATVVGSGQEVIRIKRAFFFSIDECRIGTTSSTPLISRILWKPDVDMLPPSRLITESTVPIDIANLREDLERIACLYVLETALKVQDTKVDTEIPHFLQWSAWLTDEATRIGRGECPFAPDSLTWARWGSVQRQRQIDCIKSQWKAPEQKSTYTWAASCAQSVYQNATRTLSGESPDATEDHWVEVDAYSAWAQQNSNWAYFLSLLSHLRPGLRIVEIGSKAGSLARKMLEMLDDHCWPEAWSKYTITAVSPEAIHIAKAQLANIKNVDTRKIGYSVYDPSRDPMEQGLEPGAFDLVLAEKIPNTNNQWVERLKHMRKLIAPGGRLLLHQVNISSMLAKYLTGPVLGVNTSENETQDALDRDLREAGYNGIDGISHDAEPPFHSITSVISSVNETPTTRKEITLVVSDPRPDWSDTLCAAIQREGHTVHQCSIYDNLPAQSFLISLLDLDGPFLYSLSKEMFEAFRTFLKAAEGHKMLWITNAVHLRCDNPAAGLIPGFIRTLLQETVVDCYTLEVDTFDSTAVTATLNVLAKIQKQAAAASSSIEHEFSLHEGVVFTSRCQWESGRGGITSVQRESLSKRLDIATPGLLDSLRWTEFEDPILREHEIEVDIQYVGINFRDVMIAMGLLGSVDEFGLEGSGTVRRIGSAVTGLAEGDRVLVMGSGILRTRAVTTSDNCIRVPSGLELLDAAAMPSVFATAIYSLVHLGQLQRNQTVLIHSACGGVGLASIQICRIIGAEIFATVGSEEKIKYLVDTFGIPRDHIFNSRDATFLPGIMGKTDGRGVDLVLNSLAGKLLHASWECVASFGKMIELGKRDFLGNGSLSMMPFGKNRAFFGVDLLQLAAENPTSFQRILSQFESWCAGGKIQPIRPVKLYGATEIQAALRYIQTGTHIGKIIIEMPASASLPGVNLETRLTFPSNASYLLTGGLGGLGRAISLWMAERGARHFVYLSRSAQHSEHAAFIAELESLGCFVQCVTGNVANLHDVQCAISRCEQPVKGVLHLSTVLNDRPFFEMTHEEWSATLTPKVEGTWNLHRALEKQNVDFFVLFGSIAGTCGNRNQANYNAANTFLEGFAQYRRQLGLPCSVLALGPVEDTGVLYRNSKLLDMMRAAGVRTLSEADVIDGLQLAIAESLTPHHDENTHKHVHYAAPTIVGLGATRPLSDPATRLFWQGDVRFSSYWQLDVSTNTEPESGNGQLRCLLSQVEQDPSLLDRSETIAVIREELFKLTVTYLPQAGSVEADRIAQVEIDSLMAIEVKSWIRGHLRLDISLVDISRARTVGGLAGAILEHMKASRQ